MEQRDEWDKIGTLTQVKEDKVIRDKGASTLYTVHKLQSSDTSVFQYIIYIFF